MGGGTWTTQSYVNYSTTRGLSTKLDGTLDDRYEAQDLYKAMFLQDELNPLNVVRECRDSEEHPNTVPVILALDVTGSMGSTLAEVAKKLNQVINKLYKSVDDVEVMVMGIGDLAYDHAPIQASQFESDIRIAEQLEKIYFERGGGGNGYESYTAAWYFGLRHTDLDCWKRGKKGIIITIGDEALNPYLPKIALSRVTGDCLEANIETKNLYEDVIKKFDVYHLAVNDEDDAYRFYKEEIEDSFGNTLDKNHFFVVTLDNIVNRIVEIVSNSDEVSIDSVKDTTSTEITW